MGHLRVYTISDVVARYMRLKGKNVIHPMGWDAFGLPAENAAIENGIDPSVWTNDNIAKMRAQMDLMLADFDWEREINTSDPAFYKWTQKLFLLLVEGGLAYRKKAQINWDPVDKTVLANEQVDSEGRSWRSGAIVEKRDLEQWFIGITKYAKDLAEDCDILEDWPEKVKVMQKNWIGESHGTNIDFLTNGGQKLTVFTTRPDTLFSVQFLALSLQHPIVQAAAETDKQLRQFIAEHAQEDQGSKAGYKLPSVKVSIPIGSDGAVLNVFEVPVYAATYVVDSYGSGAVMGCPGHDERDYEFWNLHEPEVPPIVTVGPTDPSQGFEAPFTSKEGKLQHPTIDLGFLNGLSVGEAGRAVSDKLSLVNRGGSTVQYRIRDWLISRQRYWGAPIPMIHCDDCGLVPVPDLDLPVLLPERDKNTRGYPLAKIESFTETTCPSCGNGAKRDTDTMDTFMDSSWYFFRYLDPKNQAKLFDAKTVTQMMPMDIYFGGVEHAILHLLYTRFIAKFLGDINYWNGSSFRHEPIKRLITQGMVQGKTFTDAETGRFLKRSELDFSDPASPIVKATGLPPAVSYQKMSKSKYNGADPEECIKKFGADATRAHMLFLAPISDPVNWNEDQIQGCERWLKRVLAMSENIQRTENIVKLEKCSKVADIELNGRHYDLFELSDSEKGLFNETQVYIRKVAAAIESDFSFNTLVSDLMKFSNSIGAALKSSGRVRKEVVFDAFQKFLILLAPIAPAIAEEAWHTLHGKNARSIFFQRLPVAQLIKDEDLSFNVIVGGKVRGQITAPTSFVNSVDEEVLNRVRSIQVVDDILKTKKVRKMIVKKGVVSVVV